MLGKSLDPPCGAVLKKRIAKAAMSDDLGDGRGNQEQDPFLGPARPCRRPLGGRLSVRQKRRQHSMSRVSMLSK